MQNDSAHIIQKYIQGRLYVRPINIYTNSPKIIPIIRVKTTPLCSPLNYISGNISSEKTECGMIENDIIKRRVSFSEISNYHLIPCREDILAFKDELYWTNAELCMFRRNFRIFGK